ncbi:MAG TPA: protein kinase [Polyangiaceae bacterium]
MPPPKPSGTRRTAPHNPVGALGESGAASGPAPSAAGLREGSIVGGKYEVLGLLGDGGMGFVVAARHLELGEVVALKFLRPEALKNPEVVARFAREARASVKIKSEYVARVFDVGTLPDGVPFIVMEHLEGEDLSAVLEKRGALPVKVAVEYVMQVCEALAAAHALGIVHRDIKPENLFLARRTQGMDVMKVLDFGISKVALTGSAFDTNLPLVRTLTPMGSPVYMSPEQIRATDDVDARSDIWSLGCVLYELLTGATAFDAPSITQLSAIILEKNPTPMRHLVPDLPPEVEAIVSRCLQKDAAARYQSVAELAVALYPFAPRRARISAERCSYMLHGNAVPPAEFELKSVPPRSMEEEGFSTLPAPESLRTSNPAMSSTHVDLQAKSTRWKPLVYIAAGAVLFGGAYGASRSIFTGPAPAQAAATVHAEPKMEPSPAQAQPVVNANPSQTAAAATAEAQPGSAAAADAGRVQATGGSRSAPRRSVGSAARRPAAPSVTKPALRPLDEVDVGF